MEKKDIKKLKEVVARFNSNWRYKELLTYIDGLLDKAREEELEWILKNCSGGGNWRRIVNQRLSKLKDNK